MDWTVSAGDELVPGRYVRRSLGGGRRCQAFATWTAARGTRTVVKLLRPHLVGDARSRRRLAREADLLRLTDGTEFVRLLDADTAADRPYLELELARGPRLSTTLRRAGPLDAATLAALARRLTRTVRDLHTRGVVHLDVKPSNVIMGTVPQLVDLSIARRFDEIPRLRSPLGSDAYMAPEQCDRGLLRTIGAPADVWGIGVTLYEAASGHMPHPRGRRDGTDAERWPQLAVAATPMGDAVDAQTAALVMPCLERAPSRRPTPSELLAALGSASRGTSARASAPAALPA
jgi:eukaryotic-like serine/threonine-protein kinase